MGEPPVEKWQEGAPAGAKEPFAPAGARWTPPSTGGSQTALAPGYLGPRLRRFRMRAIEQIRKLCSIRRLAGIAAGVPRESAAM